MPPCNDVSSGSPAKRVLVVDDDRLVSSLVSKLLSDVGFEVAEAQSTRAALDLIQQRSFDVVLADLVLGQESGLGLLRQIKRTLPDNPVIMLIASTDVRHATEAIQTGAYDFVLKPVDPALLLEVVQRAANLQRPSQAGARTEILIVDDSRTDRHVVQNILEKAGYCVKESEGLDDAVSILQSGNVAVTIADIYLKGQSGVDVLKAVREIDPDLPVIMQTSGSDVRPAIDSFRAEAFDYLLKPVQSEGLLHCVKRACEQRALVQQTRRLEREAEEYRLRLEKLGENLERLVTERTIDLRRAQDFSLSILNSMATGLIVVDREGQVTACNPSAARILHLESQSAGIGAPIEKTDPFRPFAPAVLRCLKTGAPLNREEVSLDLGGRSPVLIGYGISLLSEPGGLSHQGVILHFSDITEQRAFETALLQADKLAALGQMSAVTAHDLNGPLTLILGYAELLGRLVQGRPTQIDYVEKILMAVRHCASVVGNLLKFSRKGVYELAPVDVQEIVLGVVELVERELQKKAITVKTSFCSAILSCQGNGPELRQLFFNLLLNARDAMPDGGTISIRGAFDCGMVKMEVSDTGQGIPSSLINDVFTPFFTTKEEGRGTGLGLSICASIVRRHGGDITVCSEVGKGTSFTILLPVNRAQEAPVETPGAGWSIAKGLKVLVVDDDPEILRLCQTFIESFDCVAETVGDVRRALEIVGGRLFDFVLSDVEVAEGNGFAFVGQLNRLFPGIQVALMSGSVVLDSETVKRSHRLLDVVRKPFSREDVGRLLSLASKAVLKH